MPRYSQLILQDGGGIISRMQQSEQVENTATILIGLGGTGIDCLTEIKHAVNNRLLPDDPNGPEPRYQPIQFVGVDTDETTLKESGLSPSECCSIVLPPPPVIMALLQRAKPDWLSDNVRTVADIQSGAGCVRQIGRCCLSLNSSPFMDAVRRAITEARWGLNNSKVYVHVISGIGGGTGSGIFLDVCYMIRSIFEEMDLQGELLGYFFLPDVNLMKIPLGMGPIRDQIQSNGYAAMQELDYCMNIPDNGGSFRQQYHEGYMTQWDRPPVDMCHLISAEDENHQIMADGYHHAINAVTEYVMNFLTRSDDPERFGLSGHVANFKTMVAVANSSKRIMNNLAYCAIGGSSAKVPMKEINTYLTAGVFSHFAKAERRIADAHEVDDIAEKARINDLDMLLNELSDNGGISWFDQRIDYKTAKKIGSEPIVRAFEEQRMDRQDALERNSKSMQDEANYDSLISRACRILDSFACDLSYGTTFASSVISATQSHNLLNIIDRLLEENERRLRNERAQFEDDPASGFIGRRSAYNQAKLAFDAKPRKRQFNDLIEAMFYLEESNVNITRHEQMKTILTTLRKQLVSQSNGYYQILARVMDNLADTFAENARVLSGDPESLLDPSKFITPIIKLSDIKGTLDAEIEKLGESIPNIYEKMIRDMIADYDIWIYEDESKISRYISDFFVTQVFGDSSANSFANKTISEYLTIKYDTNDSAILKDRIYYDYMLPMAERANPLFPEDKTISQLYTSGSMTIVSVPNTAQEIQEAAADLKDINVYTSALSDRIYMMKCKVAFPLAAHSRIKQYEAVYNKIGNRPGTHIYEGRGGSDLFNDWRKLPPLTHVEIIE